MNTLQEGLDCYSGLTELDKLRRENRHLRQHLSIKCQVLLCKDADIRRLESELRELKRRRP
jgi:hypothetical protein